MANIRLNTILPDIVNNPTGIITLPGSLTLDSLISTSTTDALTPDTGAITLAGGLGIAKNISIGENISFSTFSSVATIFQNTLVGSDNKGIIISSSSINSSTRGAFFELWGNQTSSAGSARIITGTSGNFYIQTGENNTATFDSTGSLILFGTTDASSATTGTLILSNGGIAISQTTDASSFTNGGAMTIAGGASIGKSVYVGGTLTANKIYSTFVNITVTTDSTDLETGSFITAGGASVAKKLVIGGDTNLQGVTNTIWGTISIQSTSDASISTNGGISITKGIALGGQLTANSHIAVTGILTSTNTTDSTAVYNGAAVFSGGIGVAGNLQIGGNVFTNGSLTISGLGTFTGSILGTSTEDTIAIGVGSFVLAGGISVAKSARFGGNVFITGTSNHTGLLSFVSATGSGTVVLSATTASISATTGTLVVSGGFGLSGAMCSIGQISLLNTTDSDSIFSGALIISGGIGISKSVTIGSSLSVSGKTNLSDLIAVTTTISGMLTCTNKTNSTNVTNGGAVFYGGVAIGKDINIGGNMFINGATCYSGSVIFNNTCNIQDTTDSSSLGGGSFVTQGGVSIAKVLRVGGNSIITGSETISGVLTCLNSTASINSTSGCVVLSGGIGIAGSINIGGTLNSTGAATLSSTLVVTGITTLSNTTDATVMGSGALIINGGLSVVKQIQLGSTLTVNGSTNLTTLTANGSVLITNTTDATAYNTASVIFAGGLGVAKKVFFNSTLSVAETTTFISTIISTDITDSITTTTGCAQFAGGVGIVKNLNIGAALSVEGISKLTGNITNTSGNLQLNTINVSDKSGLFYIVSPVTGIRIAGTPDIKTSQYNNFLDLFSLGNSYADYNHEALQLTTTSTNKYTIMSRNAGKGILRQLLLQAGPTNIGQITLKTDGTVSIGSSTVDSTNATTGAVLISGGLGVSGSISILNSFRIMGSTLGSITWIVPETVKSYNLIWPSALPSGNMSLVSDSLGNLSWSEVTTSHPLFTTITVTSSAESYNTNSGAVQITGGISIGKSIYTGGDLFLTNSSSSSSTIQFTAGPTGKPVFTTRSLGTKLVLYPQLNSTNGDFAIGIESSYTWFSVPSSSQGFKWYAGTTNIATLSGNGSLSISDNFLISGGISSNMIQFTTTGIETCATPSFTVRSGGTRLVLYPTISESTTDIAIGVEDKNMWFTTTQGFKWYTATTNTMSLYSSESSGCLSLNSGLKLTLGGNISGSASFQAADTTSTYSLTLPSSLPSNNNYALVSTTDGVLSWSQMVTTNPSFNSVEITDTTPSTGVSTGSIIVAGGGSFASGLSVEGNFYLKGSTAGTIALKAPNTNSSPVFTLPPDFPKSSGRILVSDTQGTLSWSTLTDNVTYSMSISNNEKTPTAVSGMLFTTMFKIDIYASITSSEGNLSGVYTLKGYPITRNEENEEESIYKLFVSNIGDNIGILFTIDNNGQIFYTSNDISGWTGGNISWVGPDIFTQPGITSTYFSGANNVSAASDVTGLVIGGSQFSIYVLVNINATSSTTTLYRLEGAKQPSGFWSLTQTTTGPNQSIIFSIKSSGQIQYTSPNTLGWLSTTFTFNPTSATLQDVAIYSNLTATTAFYKHFSSNPTSTWTGAPSLNSGWNILDKSAFSVVTWMPNIAGITWNETNIIIPSTGIWNLRLFVMTSNGNSQTSFTINNSSIGNGATTAITNNTSFDSNIITTSAYSNNTDAGCETSVTLNAGTIINAWIQCQTTNTPVAIQVGVTLLQLLS